MYMLILSVLNFWQPCLMLLEYIGCQYKRVINIQTIGYTQASAYSGSDTKCIDTGTLHDLKVNTSSFCSMMYLVMQDWRTAACGYLTTSVILYYIIMSRVDTTPYSVPIPLIQL